MAPVQFKLSMSDGLTRRMSFPTRPSWNLLATRIQALCNIPLGRLGVSYVDSDGDEVTLSSEEELCNFYDSMVESPIQGDRLIKFRVAELGSLRDAAKMANITAPLQSSSRNTFGRPTPLVFEVDHDWEGLPLGNLFVPSHLDHDVECGARAHAFVEVLDDEADKENDFTSDFGSFPGEEKNKGKTRDLHTFVEDDGSSSASVIAEETPPKPPIHVQIHGLRPMDSGTFGSPPAASTPARESVTPTPAAPSITPSESPEETAQHDFPGVFPDPPTPVLDPSTDPNVSLSNDLAALLDSLNLMFLEHPEVGHLLRALFRNVGDGSYWNAQRDSMTRVANNIERVARETQTAVATGAQEMAREMRHRAQQEAARRVTEAVGNILRIFGTNSTEPSSSTHTNLGPDVPQVSNANVSGATQMPHHQTPPPVLPDAFPFYPAPPSATDQRNPFSRVVIAPAFPAGVVPPAPPPGVPPPSSMAFPHIAMGSAPVWNQFKPLGPSPGSHPPGRSSSAAYPPDVSYYTASTNRGARPSTSELRASLEAAKANYKAEKERYRREQEARRRERQLAREAVGHR
jgi:hypothetical protein